VILSGKTVTVRLADGTEHTVDISNRDELRFEQSAKISLARVLVEANEVPMWVAAGIVHWRLLRSDIEGIPADYDEFVDLLAEEDWIEAVDEGKAAASDQDPTTG
jgi:hypothetical protein